MTRVDFYILSQSGPQSRQTFACRLAEKAYRLDNTVHIHTNNAADEEDIDTLLWTFRDGSFVPHIRVLAVNEILSAPVTIGSGADGSNPCDLLINLADDVPSFAGSFPRIAELVSSDTECRQRGRKRFARYRDQGLSPETHHI